jgi:transcriptional regulator with XRE-family HTH domain
MAKKTAPLLPVNEYRIQQLGDRLRLARLRRRLTAKQVAERAGMTPVTLRNLERGNTGVTLGAYLAVMQVLGLEQDLDLLAKADPLGRELQDAALPRVPRKTGSASQPATGPADGESPGRPSARPSPGPSGEKQTDWIAGGDFVTADALALLIRPPKS